MNRPRDAGGCSVVIAASPNSGATWSAWARAFDRREADDAFDVY
jgi:hypothetical protein